MGGQGSGRPPSVESLIRKVSPQREPIQISQGDSIIIPNHSGDYSKGKVERTPTANLGIPNKVYVDTQTTNHPHQDVNTTASPTFVSPVASTKYLSALGSAGAPSFTFTGNTGVGLWVSPGYLVHDA